MIRVDDETWDAYGEVCEAKGLSRAADLRVYIKKEIAAHRRQLRAEAALSDAGADAVMQHENGKFTVFEVKSTHAPTPKSRRVVRRPRPKSDD